MRFKLLTRMKSVNATDSKPVTGITAKGNHLTQRLPASLDSTSQLGHFRLGRGRRRGCGYSTVDAPVP